MLSSLFRVQQQCIHGWTAVLGLVGCTRCRRLHCGIVAALMHSICNQCKGLVSIMHCTCSDCAAEANTQVMTAAFGKQYPTRRLLSTATGVPDRKPVCCVLCVQESVAHGFAHKSFLFNPASLSGSALMLRACGDECQGYGGSYTLPTVLGVL